MRGPYDTERRWFRPEATRLVAPGVGIAIVATLLRLSIHYGPGIVAAVPTPDANPSVLRSGGGVAIATGSTPCPAWPPDCLDLGAGTGIVAPAITPATTPPAPDPYVAAVDEGYRAYVQDPSATEASQCSGPDTPACRSERRTTRTLLLSWRDRLAGMSPPATLREDDTALRGQLTALADALAHENAAPDGGSLGDMVDEVRARNSIALIVLEIDAAS